MSIARPDPAPSAPSAPFDLPTALTYLDGSMDLLREVVSQAETDVPVLLAQAQEALLHRDLDGARKAAHTLKGTLAYLGAAPALAEARALEEAARAGDLAGAAPRLVALRSEIARLFPALRQAAAAGA